MKEAQSQQINEIKENVQQFEQVLDGLFDYSIELAELIKAEKVNPDLKSELDKMALSLMSLRSQLRSDKDYLSELESEQADMIEEK